MADVGVWIKNADIQARAGTHANTTSKATAATDVYVLDVEGRINSFCRYNFSDNYSTLNADVKELLVEWGASLCAMKVILWDISGYTAREAEFMLDALWDTVEECKRILREAGVMDWWKDGAT